MHTDNVIIINLLFLEFFLYLLDISQRKEN